MDGWPGVELSGAGVKSWKLDLSTRWTGVSQGTPTVCITQGTVTMYWWFLCWWYAPTGWNLYNHHIR